MAEKNSLWKNIRANRGSGRKPTKEMLKQERKINAKQYAEGSFVGEDELPTYRYANKEGVIGGPRVTDKGTWLPTTPDGTLVVNMPEFEVISTGLNSQPNPYSPTSFNDFLNSDANPVNWFLPTGEQQRQPIDPKTGMPLPQSGLATPVYPETELIGVKKGKEAIDAFKHVDYGDLKLPINTPVKNTGDYEKGLKKIMPEKEYLTGKYKQHAGKELKKAALAFSPSTTKALGKLDDSIAKRMLYDYRFGKYSSVKDFRKSVKQSILESERLKKIHPTLDFGKLDEAENWALADAKNLKKYADIQLMVDKSNAGQKSFMNYLGKDYNKKMDLINQNETFKNIANESPQYTDIIHEHLKNPKVSDDEFVNNLVKQSNTFTRALFKPVKTQEEFFTIKGRSLGEGKKNTTDVEGFPVSGDYGSSRYKMEPNAERMAEIAATPIEQRWAQRFPENFTGKNENVDFKQGWHTKQSEAYNNWWLKRLNRNRTVNNVPMIKYPSEMPVPHKYINYPQHSIFNSELGDQSIKGFDVSKINIDNPHKYIPGFTRGLAEGGYYPTQGPPKALFKGYADGGPTGKNRWLMTDKDWKDINTNDYGAEEAKVRGADTSKYDIYRLPNNKFELVPKVQKQPTINKKIDRTPVQLENLESKRITSIPIEEPQLNLKTPPKPIPERQTVMLHQRNQPAWGVKPENNPAFDTHGGAGLEYNMGNGKGWQNVPSGKYNDNGTMYNSYVDYLKASPDLYNVQGGFAQGGYTNPYNQYQDDPYLQYKVGGQVLQGIGEIGYGVLGSGLNALTFGATKGIVDKGHDALQKAANPNFDPNNPNDLKAINNLGKARAIGQGIGAVGTALTGNIAGAAAAAGEAANTYVQTTDASDDIKKGVGAISGIGSLGYGMAKIGSGPEGMEVLNKIAPMANQAVGFIGGQSLAEQGNQAQDYLNSPEYLALKKQGDVTVNQGINFSQGGNMLNNSLNLRNTMRNKRFAQGGTLEQQGINFITDDAGFHHQSANGGVPIGPGALAEGGEAKLQMADGGQYIVSDQVDGANTQTINGQTMAERLKKKLQPFMMGGLASNPKDKDNLRRPFDSYSAESIAQVKDNAIQETEAVRLQRGGAVQYAANGGKLNKDIEKIVMEEYTAAYGGTLPNKYKGKVNMPNSYAKGGIHINESKKGTFTAAATKHGKGVQEFAKQVLAHKENYSPGMVKKANFAHNAAGWKHADGGYVHNQMTQPMYAEGGSTWVPPDAELLGMGYAPDQIEAIKLADKQSPVFESEDKYKEAQYKAARATQIGEPRGMATYNAVIPKRLDAAYELGSTLRTLQPNRSMPPISGDVQRARYEDYDKNRLRDEDIEQYGKRIAREKELNEIQIYGDPKSLKQPIKAEGGPIYGDPASDYVYARGGMYGDPYARGGQIDYTNDMYSSYAGGGPMVSNVNQPFKGPSAQNRGGMLMNYADGGMMPPEQQMMQEQQQAPQEQMQQQGGQDQMMQMVQQVAQEIMQGENPQKIMSELANSGMPQEQVQQIMQAAMQMADQQQQQQPMQQGEQPMQGQEQQMPPQQGMATGGKMYYEGGPDGPPYNTVNPFTPYAEPNTDYYRIQGLSNVMYNNTRGDRENNVNYSPGNNNNNIKWTSKKPYNLTGWGAQPAQSNQSIPGPYRPGRSGAVGKPKTPAYVDEYGNVINDNIINPRQKTEPLSRLDRLKQNYFDNSNSNNPNPYLADSELKPLPTSVGPIGARTEDEASMYKPFSPTYQDEIDYTKMPNNTPLNLTGWNTPKPTDKIPGPINPNTIGPNNITTEAEAIEQGWKPEQPTTTTPTTPTTPGGSEGMSAADWGTMIGQLAGPASQFFQKKPKPFQYQKAQAKTLDPTAAIVLANQASREAQATSDYNIKQNAPTSGSYLANMRANALQSGLGRGKTGAGITQQYDINNAGILNQMEQYNTDIENRNIDAMQQDQANFQEQRTNALYNAGANIAGMRKDYKANEVNNLIAKNLGTANFKYDPATETFKYPGPDGQMITVPASTVLGTNAVNLGTGEMQQKGTPQFQSNFGAKTNQAFRDRFKGSNSGK